MIQLIQLRRKFAFWVVTPIVVSFLVLFPKMLQADETSYNSELTKLISYERLMALTPQQRAHYLATVRDLLVAMEKDQIAANPSDLHGAKWESFAILLGELLQDASAQTIEEESREQSNDIAEYLVIPSKRKGESTCTMYKSHLLTIPYTLPNTNLQVCRTLSAANESCDRGFIAVSQDRDSGMFACVTRDSFLALPLKIQSQMIQPKIRRDLNPKRFDAFLAQGKPRLPVYSCEAGKIAVDQVRSGGFYCMGQHDFQKLSPAEQNRRTSQNPKSKDPRLNETFQVMGATRANPLTVEAVTVTAARPLAKVNPLSNCSPDAKPSPQCTDANRSIASDMLYHKQPHSPSCVYAGNFSSYIENRPLKNKCTPVTQMCDDGGTKCETQPLFQCESGKVLCNPVVFQLQSNRSPFCVNRGASATQNCADLSNAVTGENSKLSIFDAKSGIDADSAKKIWKHFATGFNQICHGSKEEKVYFCRECALMEKAMFAENIDLLQGGDANLSCHALYGTRLDDVPRKNGTNPGTSTTPIVPAESSTAQ